MPIARLSARFYIVADILAKPAVQSLLLLVACGTASALVASRANQTAPLERGYASVTTNGGHDSASGFDGA